MKHPRQILTNGARCYILLAGLCLSSAANAVAELPQRAPAQLGFNAERLEHIDAAVAAAIADKQIPGCVVCIGRRGGIAWLKAYGNRQLKPSVEPMTVDAVFDMASITKPTATATSIMILLERGRVRLRDPVADYIPKFAQNGKEQITVEQLLTHQGGLIPDNPVGDYQHGADEAWQRIWELKPIIEPGTKFIYTDVGFLVLAEVVRTVSGQPINEFAAENIFRPLGMTETGYLPVEELRKRAAPTEQRDGKWLRGEVHDPRSALLGGVAGHAGLFSTASDMAIYANALLHGGGNAPGRILGNATFREMIRPRDVAGHKRALGWDVASKYSTNRGENFSRRAFGHGGFTGTAMWIDPDLNLFVILLSNRLHPDGKGGANPLAGRIGTIAAAALTSPPPRSAGDGLSEGQGVCKAPIDRTTRPPASRDPANTLCGIDVLERDNFTQLAGSKVGMITNHTGVNRNGRRTIDLLHAAPNVELVAIFSPEHGITGTFDQPDIDDGRDQATGAPIYSLYGQTDDEHARRPEPRELEGIDTLVYDIQDIGCRFYTYISTMGLAMEAAAEHDLQFVVLDRPNPIGGVEVGGPLLDVGRESFVGFHQMPLRHGMTVGELAKMFREQRKIDVDLQVIEATNWRRRDQWDATGLTWINPSPNMRSLTQALLYPGVGLLETTNVSVGRGTDTPFEVLGAPWIDGRKFAAALNAAGVPGVRFVPIRFTPTASKFAGDECGGVNLHVVDRRALVPTRLGIQLACTLRQLYPNEWELQRFNRLLINKEIYDAIASGETADQVQARYAPDTNSFQRERQQFLLYR